MKMVRNVLCLLLLVCMVTAPLGCLSINKSPDNEPKKDVNIGGEHGITVER